MRNYLRGAIRSVMLWTLLSAFSPVPAINGSDEVAATVNDTKVFVSQVDWLFSKKFGQRKIEADLATQLRAHLLKQLVNQQAVVEYLKSVDQAATLDEVDLEVERIALRLKGINKTLQQFLSEDHQTIHGLKSNLQWQMTWRRYLEKQLTDENLEKFFKLNQRQFDGTQMHVAHLLIKVDQKASSSEVDAAKKEIEKLRQQIGDGQIGWNDAVVKYSQGATKDRSGDLGWIGANGPMPKEFTKSAFDLEQGELSQVVRTNFGFHLVKCLGVRSGTAKWYDVRSELKNGAIEFLFNQLREQHAEEIAVRYTGAAPYLDPDSGQLVVKKE